MGVGRTNRPAAESGARFAVLRIGALVVAAAAWSCANAGDPNAGAAGSLPLDSLSDGPGNARFAPQDTAQAPDNAPGAAAETVNRAPADSLAQVGNCDFAAAPKAGQPGATCKSSDECDSGYCIDGPAGKICTMTCSACCPTGFACEAASASDPQFICRAKLNAVCRPCEKDSECNKLSPSALCVGYGNLGRFCGGACSQDGDCYSGYACKDSKGSDGSGKQCVKVQGECSCSPQMVTDGAKTTCTVSNELGACKGVRKCAGEGLSACDAPTPATETCDGKDNNCNGQADEPGAVGCQTYYVDADGDGMGDSSLPGLCQCAAGDKYKALIGGDCDDSKASVKAGANEQCNGVDDDCDGKTDNGFPDTDGDAIADCVDPDIDNDGTANAADCAPANANISPAATETCNDIDDNCNGSIDEPGANGCKTYYIDIDGDGFGKPPAAGTVAQCICKPDGKLSSLSSDDCNDLNGAINPLATEVCNDKDDNCDGKTDEGCDDDQDGWCDAKMVVVDKPTICSQGNKDCDDLNAAISPGAKELCGTNVDENCDGLTDAGTDAKDCIDFFKDGDKDSFGAGNAKCLCAADGQYTATNNNDCNDDNALQNPGKGEQCGNGIDDNCNGKQDEEDAAGCELYYADSDGDGYGSTQSACLCGPSQLYVTKNGGDCKPDNPEINPGAQEVCNGIDDNCKNGIDETGAKGCTTFYVDKDGDGIGDSKLSKCLCKPDGQYTATSSGDCDDTNAAAKPGALEACDGIDNDCNGQTDEQGADGCKVVFIDEDGDKYGAAASGVCLCALGGKYNATKGGDCNDQDIAIHPGAPEFCDGQDNNCNGQVDEEDSIGCVKYLKDADKDGYGVSGAGKCLCKPTFPYTEFGGGDCNDDSAVINPKALEVCDGIDNNCDGATDPSSSEGCTAFFQDADKDGYGSYLVSAKCLCKGSDTYTTGVGGDCNDNDPKSYPKAPEYCDGKDTDCDGIIDPKNAIGCKTFYIDLDGDGYGPNSGSECACNIDPPFVATKGGDCNEQNGAINPGAQEVCNQIDDNCNGQTDEGAAGGQNYYLDNDGDGYGVGNPMPLCGGPKPPWSATKNGDCNDNNAKINPGMPEIPCNGVDDNCDGLSPGGQSSYTMDFNSGAQGWTTGTTNGVNFWALSSKSGGTAPTVFTSVAYGTPNQGSQGWEQSYLLGPIVNMQGGGTIKFDTWQSNETGYFDREFVDISYDGGGTWQLAIDYTNALWTPQVTWQTVTMNVPAGVGTANTRVRFRYDTVDGCCGPTAQTGWYIDNFIATSTCQ